ncbi:MAG: carboxypeptidase M32 [Anaerolineaceae bacterium]
MSFEENLKKLRENYAEQNILNGISALLGWDQQVYMPSGGAEQRGSQLAYLGGLAHEKATSPALGQLIADLVAEIPDLDADEDLAREVKLAKRSFDINTKIPTEKMMEFIRVTSIAQDVWGRAKHNNDFATFRPHLEHIVALTKELAEFFAPYEHPYDALLDMYEPGMKTAEVRAVFDALRPRQVELLRRIAEKPQVDDSFAHTEFDVDAQKKLSNYIASLQGYDWKRGRLDETAHPFTTNFGMDDVRITTKYIRDLPLSALFSTMHEVGHALYEQGLSREYNDTPLGGTSSMAIHESNSRLWENVIGRSREFWHFLYPVTQAFFPANLANVNAEQFYRGINKISPSFIRTEADEATYNLHIMLRLELEIALIEDKIAVKDLPELWMTKMQDYLGVTPPNDTQGVLQDVHWSGGMIGYFPTYALGNLIAAQWWDKMLVDQPNIPDEMAAGKLETVLLWLRENVHCHSSRYSAQELVKKVTGEGINPDHYMNYLTKKYTDIYGL